MIYISDLGDLLHLDLCIGKSEGWALLAGHLIDFAEDSFRIHESQSMK